MSQLKPDQEVNLDLLPLNPDSTESTAMKKIQYHSLEFKQFIKKYDLVFSPRTSLSKQREHDNIITNQLIKHFDPFTVNFLKKDFDNSYGKANKAQFIGCLKNHLLQWQPQAEKRQEKLIKYLSIIYDEIDLLDSKIITWEDFSNYLISKASSIGGLVGGQKGAGKAMSNIAAGAGSDDGNSSSQTMGSVEKIKSFSLTMAANIPPRDKDKHKLQNSQGSGGIGSVDSENNKLNGDKNSKKNGANGAKDEGKGTLLHKAVYIPELDKIALVEERSDTIQFMNARNGERGCKDLDCGVDAAKLATGGKGGGFNYSQFKKKIIVMSLIYLRLEDYNNLLLVATDDSLIRAWYYNGNQFAPVNPIINDEAHEGDIKILKAKQPQYCMAWDDVHQMLYSGQRDGMINVWNLRSSKPVGFLGTSTDIQSIMQHNKQQHQLQQSLQNRGKPPFMKPGNSGSNTVTQHQSSQSEQSPMGLTGDMFGGVLHQNINRDNFGHKDIVTELLMLPKLQYLASCSLDKKVILWDTITGEQKRVYTDHTMGVVSMTFNSEHILLFSAGFDHDIYVWNPYIDNPVFKVQAHNAPIVCVFAIDHTPQLISSDADGLVKVWDIRTFECVQTINVQENFEQFKFNLSYMLPIWQHKRLLIAGRQLLFFEYDKNQNPSLADDQAPLCCEYINRTQEFYTPVLDSVKCWNALNGSIKHIFKNDIVSSGAEITAFCLDLNQKRFIIGDSKGLIRIFNCISGELMKTLTEHQDGEILNLMAVKTKEMSMIVSVGSNSVIQLHEDDKMNGVPAVRRTIQIANYEVHIARVYYYEGKAFNGERAASNSNNMKYLIVGLNKGSIKTYELETGRPDASYPAYPDSSDLNEIYTLKTKPFFFTTDNHGMLTLWIGPPCLNKYQKAFEMQNIDLDKNEPVAINCIVYDEEEDILFTGDERGTVCAYYFKDIIQGVHVKDPSNKTLQYQNLDNINPQSPTKNAQANLNTTSAQQQIRGNQLSIQQHQLNPNISSLSVLKKGDDSVMLQHQHTTSAHQHHGSVRKQQSQSIDEFTFNLNNFNQYPPLTLMWRSKEHSESIRHLKFLNIYEKKLLISTSYDRKVKIWDSLTGEHIDSLRKGNSDESYPISYREKPNISQLNFKFGGGAQLGGSGTAGAGVGSSKSGPNTKKIIGLDIESLKRKVENNPAIDKIKETIDENTKSTEWKLHLDVDKIAEEQLEYISGISKVMQEAEDNQKSSIYEGGRRSSGNLGATGTSIRNQQMDLEMLGKVFNIYQQKANEIMIKSSHIMGAANNTIGAGGGGFTNQLGGQISQYNGAGAGNQRSLIASNSQPLFNLKAGMGAQAQSIFGNSMRGNQGNLGASQSNFLMQTQNQNILHGGAGLSIVSQVKSELNKVEEGIVPRRKRFVEQKESLATQKLLYPSKFRKDPYRNKINQQQHHRNATIEAGNTISGLDLPGNHTKLPSIMRSKGTTSGQMLMGMMGLNDNKRLPRNVSEAALKFIQALDKVQ